MKKYLSFQDRAISQTVADKYKALEAERVILGTLLEVPSLIAEIGSRTSAKMFSDEHKQIAEAIYQMAKEGVIMRPAEVRSRVTRSGGHVNEKYITDLFLYYETDAFLSEVCTQIVEAYEVREKFRAVLSVVEAYEANEDILSALRGYDKISSEVIETIETDSEARYRISDAKDEVLAQIEQAQQGKAIGIPTPFHHLTKSISGLELGDLTILGAGSGMGKSTLALQFVHAAAELGTPAAYISIEMPKSRAFRKMIPFNTGISETVLKSGKLETSQFQSVKQAGVQLSKLPIFILDDVHYIDDIEREVSFLTRKHNVKLVCIDHLGIVKTRGWVSDTEKYNFVAYELKRIAKTYKCHIVVLSQLNRESQKEGDREPQLTDLRLGGEPAADVVLMPQRITSLEDYKLQGYSEILLHPVKRRDGGRDRPIALTYIEAYSSYFDGDPTSANVRFKIESNGSQVVTPENNIITKRGVYNDDDMPF